MKEKLKSLVEIFKMITYLTVAVTALNTYLQRDFILGEIARLSAPYNQVYFEEAIEEFVPSAIISALNQDSVKVYINKEQWDILDDKLYNNKLEILTALPIEANKVSKRVMHDFLIVERELHNPLTGETYYLKGILLGKRPNGTDDWIWRISDKKEEI